MHWKIRGKKKRAEYGPGVYKSSNNVTESLVRGTVLSQTGEETGVSKPETCGRVGW